MKLDLGFPTRPPYSVSIYNSLRKKESNCLSWAEGWQSLGMGRDSACCIMLLHRVRFLAASNILRNQLHRSNFSRGFWPTAFQDRNHLLKQKDFLLNITTHGSKNTEEASWRLTCWMMSFSWTHSCAFFVFLPSISCWPFYPFCLLWVFVASCFPLFPPFVPCVDSVLCSFLLILDVHLMPSSFLVHSTIIPQYQKAA